MIKRFLLFVLASMVFGACVEETISDPHNGLQPDVEDDAVLTIGFEGDDTRVQLNAERKAVWTKGDCLSVFNGCTSNHKWQYQGETGETIGDFKSVQASGAGIVTDKIVAVYPYNKDFSLDADTYNVKAFLPAVQTYLKDSYGLDGTIMISQSEYKQFSLKNVCGWLKLQLSGKGEQVSSITVRGNNGEQVAGELYIDSSDATSVLVSDDGEGVRLTEVALDCPEGVSLGSEAASFYIALPPQTFEKGLTVEVNCTDGVRYCKYTQKSITIERNVIQPLSVIEPEEDMAVMDPDLPPYNEIWYTSTTGGVVPLKKTAGFGANVVSNTYENGRGVIKFDGVVTAIGARAFNEDYSVNTALKTVTIPESVTSIGELAFRNCTVLEEINLHDGITHIGERAFIYTALTEVSIPKGLTELSKQVFDSTPLKSIVIPDNIKKIGEMAFCLCDNLETIVIGDGVTEIGNQAFEIWNSSVVSVILGKNVTTMGSHVFDGCTGTLTITGNIPFTESSEGNNQNAWIRAAKFTEIIIADEVETIPDYAFYSSYLPELKKITIGKGVKSIGSRIIHNTLSEVDIKDLKSYCQIDLKSSLLDGANLLVNGRMTSDLVIPDGVTQIPSYAFHGCTNLQFVTIPASVTSIGSYAFYGCKELISVNGAASLSEIGVSAFNGCSKLAYMPVTSNLTRIDASAFDSCSELRLSSSPVNVITIGSYAFSGCKKLIYSLDIRKATSIGSRAFHYCTSITSVDISSASTIGSYAFQGCRNMTQVSLCSGLTSIEDYAFSSTGLQNVVLPDGLQSIGESAFASTKLVSLIIPASVTYIDCYAFESNRNLSTVYCMPATPPSVGTDYDDGDRYWDAFDGCAAGCMIYVPQSSLDSYKSASYWKEYKDKMVGYSF